MATTRMKQEVLHVNTTCIVYRKASLTVTLDSVPDNHLTCIYTDTVSDAKACRLSL